MVELINSFFLLFYDMWILTPFFSIGEVDLPGADFLVGLLSVVLAMDGFIIVLQFDKEMYYARYLGILSGEIEGELFFVEPSFLITNFKEPVWSLLLQVRSFFWGGLKLLLLSMFFVLTRSALPRYRYDQLMYIGWKSFLPVTIGYIFVIIGFCFFYELFPEVIGNPFVLYSKS